ncbi:putative Seipin family protein [Lupinus albus]|uniref:Putative Seipin family protein n=1 Tax=Lupinus albus TaxID=3870 RepID=A0A6A4PI22_LUPAL|nr:putative Seipin family protein [Lupinus albus]
MNKQNDHLPLQLPNLTTMDSLLQNDDVFIDALDDCLFLHCSADGHDDMSESSPSSSTISHPDPPSPSPATTLRRRSIRHRSPIRDSANSTNIDSENILNDGSRTSSRHNRNPEVLKENEIFTEKVRSFPSPSAVTEEKKEESTSTTAQNDDVPSDDSAESALELRDSSSNLLDYITGLVISAILFQVKLFVFLMKLPMLSIFHFCMFCVDPYGTIEKGKIYFMEILGRVWDCVFGCIGPSLKRFFNEDKSFWNIAFRCGWGLLWSIYVCCILIALLVSSLMVSGILMNRLVEKRFQMKQVLNFDYTKQKPIAYVPTMSCAGVVQESETNVAVSEWVSKGVIPAKQKVQVIVSLVVPESGYNRNLGVFQIRVDLLSSNGKTITSSSQPCMLKFRSEPIRLIMTFLKIVPLVTGYISETQTLNVKIRGLVVGDVPTSCLKVTLEQRSEYVPGSGIPQIYDSSILVESELPFIKRIIWYWKMSIFIWITIMAFMMQFLFVLVCCWPIIIPRTRQRSATHNNLHTTI